MNHLILALLLSASITLYYCVHIPNTNFNVLGLISLVISAVLTSTSSGKKPRKSNNPSPKGKTNEF